MALFLDGIYLDGTFILSVKFSQDTPYIYFQPIPAWKMGIKSVSCSQAVNVNKVWNIGR